MQILQVLCPNTPNNNFSNNVDITYDLPIINIQKQNEFSDIRTYFTSHSLKLLNLKKIKLSTENYDVI